MSIDNINTLDLTFFFEEKNEELKKIYKLEKILNRDNWHQISANYNFKVPESLKLSEIKKYIKDKINLFDECKEEYLSLSEKIIQS